VTSDPFPRERLTATMHRVPAYGRLAFGLAMDPRLAKKRRAAVVAAAGYLISPVDLVPGIVPVLGQLDDIAVAMAALRFALAGLDSARRAEHLAAVGLADSDLSDDIATLAAVSAWSLRAGVRTTRRAAAKTGQLATSGARAAADAASAGAAKVSPRLREPTAPMAQRVVHATPQAAKDAGAKVVPAARAATAKVGPAAKQVGDRLSPVASGAASRMGRAARAAAQRSADLARKAADRDPKVTVSAPEQRALPAPAAPVAPAEPPEPPSFG
jgi:uncharacterized membrane protein YkvA (DUF1232 family)